MVILGLILLIVGLVAKIAVVRTIGIILMVVGIVLRIVTRRRHVFSRRSYLAKGVRRLFGGRRRYF